MPPERQFIYIQLMQRNSRSIDIPLEDGDTLDLGEVKIHVLHIPGHTPGQCCFRLDEDRIIVGDTVFVGGPGRTGSPGDFSTTMDNMRDVVFNWPDSTQFFPGHGPSGTIGEEKPAFLAFLNRGGPPIHRATSPGLKRVSPGMVRSRIF